MNFLTQLFSDPTPDMCMEYKAERMPTGVQLKIQDSTRVEKSDPIDRGVYITFKGGGHFRAVKNGKNHEIELVDPGTATFVYLDGEVVIEQPKGTGSSSIKTDGGTLIRQSIR